MTAKYAYNISFPVMFYDPLMICAVPQMRSSFSEGGEIHECDIPLKAHRNDPFIFFRQAS